jgi:DNA-binding transcriptional ArsR family regulator
MNESDAIFKAVAHSARREILSLLAASDRSVKELTAAFDISQPAVSQHLRELKKARLVASQRDGIEQIYRLTPGPIKILFEWSSQYRRFFDPSGHAWAFVPGKRINRRKTSRKGERSHGR